MCKRTDCMMFGSDSYNGRLILLAFVAVDESACVARLVWKSADALLQQCDLCLLSHLLYYVPAFRWVQHEMRESVCIDHG